MKLELDLYQWLALIAPGALLLLALTASPFIRVDVASPNWIHAAIALLLAFFAGHLVSWVSKQFLASLRLFVPAFREPKKQLLRVDRDSPTAFQRYLWQPLLASRFGVWITQLSFTRKMLARRWPIARWFYGNVVWKPYTALINFLPWPRDPKYTANKIHRLITTATEISGSVTFVKDWQVFGICYAYVKKHGDLKDYEKFTAQADFLKNSAVSLVLAWIVYLFYGLPPIFKANPNPFEVRLVGFGYLIVAIVYMVRHQHFDYLAANSIYEQFLGLTEGTQQTAHRLTLP